MVGKISRVLVSELQVILLRKRVVIDELQPDTNLCYVRVANEILVTLLIHNCLWHLHSFKNWLPTFSTFLTSTIPQICYIVGKPARLRPKFLYYFKTFRKTVIFCYIQ